MEPFKALTPKDQSNIQKLLKQLPQENGIIEINNYLASVSLSDMERTPVSKIETKYNLKKYKNHVSDLQKLLQSFCGYYCNLELPNPGFEKLNHFIQVIGLENNDSTAVVEQAALDRFKKEYENVVNTGTLTEEQMKGLDVIAERLSIPEKSVNSVSETVRREKILSMVSRITADGEISPEEDDELTVVQKNLHVTLSFDEKIGKDLEKLRNIWRINHGDLSPVYVEVNLQKNEKCYFESAAEWFEQRAVAASTNYAGPTGRVRIAKGLYYRYGRINHSTVSRQELTFVDDGNLFFTNKRIIFMGKKKNTTISLDSILEIVPYSDGLGVQKATGKSPNIKILKDADYANAILLRLMRG
jgi:hypothetical protein